MKKRTTMMRSNFVKTLYVIALAAIMFVFIWASYAMFEYDASGELNRAWSIIMFILQCVINALVVTVFRVIKSVFD